jgi:precorrin-2 dehydrogenase/sirohydrochlorin ferrochelatase
MLLDVSDRQIVIIGGGKVAARKAAGLISAGATRLRAIAPEFHAELNPMVERIPERYRPDHLGGAQLVFAATDSADVNQAVVRDAHARGLLVCRADRDHDDQDDAAGDFVTPAQSWRGPVQVSVSAGSAALSALIRDAILMRWDEGWTNLAQAMQTIRPKVINASQHDAAKRTAIFRDLASGDAVEVARSSGADGVIRWLDARHPGWST